MIKRLVLIMAVATPALSWGQMVISSGTNFVATPGTNLVTTNSIDNRSSATNFSGLNLLLAAPTTPANPQLITTSPLVLKDLIVDSKNTNPATFQLIGDWTVTNALTLTNGKIVVNKLSNIGTLTYEGTADLDGKNESYINGRLLVKGTGGKRTFPIGNAIGYFPARLDNLDAADVTTSVGMEVIAADPGFAPVTGSVKEIFTDHFWELTTGSTSGLTGRTPVSLSSNGTTAFFDGTGDATILEMNNTNVQGTLGAAIGTGFYTSTSSVSAKAKTFALAKSDKITVVVHKLITPDNDQINDVLVIEGLDSFPDNEVTLLDRWGVPFMSKKGFANYTQPAGPTQAGVDYSKLAIGNYICVIKYLENGAEKSIRQMITVLK